MVPIWVGLLVGLLIFPGFLLHRNSNLAGINQNVKRFFIFYFLLFVGCFDLLHRNSKDWQRIADGITDWQRMNWLFYFRIAIASKTKKPGFFRASHR